MLILFKKKTTYFGRCWASVMGGVHPGAGGIWVDCEPPITERIEVWWHRVSVGGPTFVLFEGSWTLAWGGVRVCQTSPIGIGRQVLWTTATWPRRLAIAWHRSRKPGVYNQAGGSPNDLMGLRYKGSARVLFRSGLSLAAACQRCGQGEAIRFVGSEVCDFRALGPAGRARPARLGTLEVSSSAKLQARRSNDRSICTERLRESGEYRATSVPWRCRHRPRRDRWRRRACAGSVSSGAALVRKR